MQPKTQRSGFTLLYERVTNILYSDIGLSEAFSPESGGKQPNVIGFHGIWDTGATCSGITSKVVCKLNLQPIDQQSVSTAKGEHIANVYLINIYLPNRVAFSGVPVTDVSMTDADLLIGMDIINDGDFAATNFEGKTCMSFQNPSSRKIDFVKEIRQELG